MPDPSSATRPGASPAGVPPDFTGTHPFALQICFGDEQRRAYVPDGAGAVYGPGLQLLTNATEGLLAQAYGLSRAQIHDAACRLGVDLPYLLNVACQTPTERFAGRLRELAVRAGRAGLDGDDWRSLELFKSVIEQVQGLGPQVIVRAAISHLAAGAEPGGPPYGQLLGYVNRALAIHRDRAPGFDSTPLRGVEGIGAEGVQLWWIKEGSATIVFRVLVHLSGPRPPVAFALNVAKDLTAAGEELRRVGADLAELHQIDPRHVVRPFGTHSVTVANWRGPVTVPLLAAEWFDGHELHVYADSPLLHVWQDQRMGKDHPLAPEASDRVWETIVRLGARYTRTTPDGLLPLASHINAGDFIVRQRAADAWDIVLIWCRRMPPGAVPADFIVLAGLMAATRAFGPDCDRTVWWDQPERGLAAMRAGLEQAGLTPSQVGGILHRVHERLLATPPQELQQHPYLAQFDRGDRDEMRRVFARACAALGKAAGGSAQIG